MLGADLTAIPTIGVETALTFAAEIGGDLSRFPSARHFCSWLGLSPGTRISGEKRLGGRAMRQTNRVGQALRMAASTARNSKTALGAAHRRRLQRMDPVRAVKATAHQLARLRARVEWLLGEAEAVDASEDSRYGAGTRADELPEELRRRESRLKRIREAKAALEAEARNTRARTLREQAEGHERTAHTHRDPVVRRRARTNATKRRAKAEEFGPGDDDPPGGGNGGGELPRKPTLATPQGVPVDEAQRNFTDPESSIMMGADGFVQAYNAQLAVDDAHQVIVACGVTDQPSDAANFAPMLERVRANVGAAPEHATGDTGYWNPHVETRARALGTEAWVATARVRHGDAGPATRTGDPPDDLDPRERMRWRLDTSQGRTRYARRKAVVEPVNGQIKHARRFRQFSLRGIGGVDAEWVMVSLCHNVLKLFGHRGAGPCPA